MKFKCKNKCYWGGKIFEVGEIKEFHGDVKNEPMLKHFVALEVKKDKEVKSPKRARKPSIEK